MFSAIFVVDTTYNFPIWFCSSFQIKLAKLYKHNKPIMRYSCRKIRGGSGAAATSKMERFVIIVNGLAVNYYHKALHLGCCSSPRSAFANVEELMHQTFKQGWRTFQTFQTMFHLFQNSKNLNRKKQIFSLSKRASKFKLTQN